MREHLKDSEIVQLNKMIFDLNTIQQQETKDL